MSTCIHCEGTIKVNYSCYDIGGTEIYICNDCEQEYYNGNYELYSMLTQKERNLITKKLEECRKCGDILSDENDNWSIEDNICNKCSKY